MIIRFCRMLLRIFLLVFLVFTQVQCKNVLKDDFQQSQYLDKSVPQDINILLMQYDKAFSVSDLWNSVKRGMKNLWNFVKESASKSIDRIKEMIIEFRYEAEQIIDQVKKELEALRQEIMNKIEEIRKNAETLGHVVIDCYKKEEQGIEIVLIDTLKNIQVCVKDSILKADFVEENATRSLAKADIVDDLELQLEACKEEKDLDLCLIKLQDYSQSIAFDFHDELMEHYSQTRGIVADLQNAITQCTTRYLSEASMILTGKVVSITACVMDAVNESEVDSSGSLEAQEPVDEFSRRS